MKINILEKKEEPLLSRTSITAEADYPSKATPGRGDIEKEIASQLNADIKLLTVKHIYPIYGKQKAKLFAYLYKDQDSFLKLEPEKKEEKPIEKPKPEAKKEEVKEEKPKEEIKEEKKEDGKEESKK